MSDTKNPNFFDTQIFGHPAGLFVLFFTEMWERFSFYGMRVLLVNFLTMALVGYNPGWAWTAENATALFGTYALLLYLTPIAGGIIADKFTGYRWAVVIGAAIMTLGHASMALETEFSLYAGLVLLVIGTGFFKPNITSIISEMYKELPEKKDGAYTIFYMGVNAGAFFGMMLCGYLAERIGWSWGFGLAGIFMMLGTLQFWLAKPLFGHIGDVPTKQSEEEIAAEEAIALKNGEGSNPFTQVDKILIIICTVLGLGYAINDPLSKIGGINLFPFEIGSLSGQYVAVLIGLVLFLYLVSTRIARYTKVVRDRMIAVIIFAFFTVFFWLSFEQGATSLVLFARDNVDRVLSGNSAVIFNVVNTLLTVVPLAFITYVLYLLGKRTYKTIPGSNVVLVVCFLAIWGVVGWMLNRDFQTTAYDITYSAIETPALDDKNQQKKNEDGELVFNYTPITENTPAKDGDKIVERTTSIAEPVSLAVGDDIKIITKDNEGSTFGYLDAERLTEAYERGERLGEDNGVIVAKVSEIKDSEVEITVSWFSILNSFFIIVFASMFSKWWDSKYNPSAAVKYGLGLIIMAVGFGLLALGSYGITEGVKVSMIWLILAYLFHTLGELCLSPVGLSYVSKLVPARMIAFMFGMWYLAIAIGNKIAAVLGGQIENITEQYDLTTFFLIFTIVPAVAGILVMLLNPLLKKLMHGVR
ncbi:MAG: peptide MFS transporter [Saprospiraceae bacterium]